MFLQFKYIIKTLLKIQLFAKWTTNITLYSITCQLTQKTLL